MVNVTKIITTKTYKLPNQNVQNIKPDIACRILELLGWEIYWREIAFPEYELFRFLKYEIYDQFK